jgi:zinc protease
MNQSLCACVLTLVLTGSGLAANSPVSQLADRIDIPFQKFVLKNGLTLIVHEDHKAPIVAVNVWYHVGSKNEQPGKTGFAHLFEHLMFNGSEHFNDDYFQAMERIGATVLNGTTSEDRTDYFENVPKNALDIALWMESDRMGHLLGAVDQAKLDEQRGVVQNEKRQGENQPYGRVELLITKGTTPAGHPYSWSVIGSMEDLNAASLDDVRNWFKSYYGAANAVLVVAGDIEPNAALKLVEKYFGDIPAGPPVTKFAQWIPKLAGVRREVMEDRVPQARLYQVWNITPYGDADTTYLDLLSDVLTSGKSSRLYKRLVYDDQIATDVSAYVDRREICGAFGIAATARPGGDLKKVEQAVNEEVARLLARGPTKEELTRAKTQFFAHFIRGIEGIGGFGGKSDILAMNQTYRGQPDYYKKILHQVENATTKDLQAAGARWLGNGVYILEVHPYADHEVVKSDVDRSKLPLPGSAPEVKFPELQRTTLANGLKIVLAERHAIPTVNLNLILNAGFAADQFAAPGTARLAMDMIDEGTKTRSALQISDDSARLGAVLRAGSDLDTSTVYLNALTPNLDQSLALFADIILHPSFPQADFERLQKQRLAEIKREKSEPRSMAMRVLPGLLYGKSHAYGNPLTGSGTELSVAKLSRDDMTKFHATWFKPNNATLVVVGDTTLKELTPKIDRLFAGWKTGDIPQKNLGAAQPHARPSIYLIDRPGSIQSMIVAANLAPATGSPDDIAMETMNDLLGGVFTSRLNMNLREDKHWTYGARSVLSDARGPRPFLAYAPVQTDKTKESMSEIAKELDGILGKSPVKEEELNKARKNATLRLPGQWETSAQVAGAVGKLVRFTLPDDYFNRYPDKIRALSQSDIEKAAREVVHPNELVWVVVGDRAKIEPGIRELGWGEIQVLNPE